MQERVRAVEFVLARCGVATGVPSGRESRVPGRPQMPRVESWPHALLGASERDA
jgi:hypothetical protein